MQVLRAVFLSFLFHFLLLLTVAWLAPRFSPPPPPETIEVTLDEDAQILDALTPKKQQIVRQALTPEKMKAPDDETLARFLSEQKQRVQQETRAAATGMTANRDAQKSQQKNSASDKNNLPKAKASQKDKDGYQSVDISKELQEMRQFNEGLSTVGESLPQDVKVGSFTALNTDRYLYYTFYARMEELIRYRWESRVQHAINSFDRPNLMSLGNRNWVTHVEFLLDKNGFLQKALVMKESGVRAFDAAAIEAFREARVFPNPPKEMVQDDGFIHIKFSFTVNYNPPVLVNRN